MTMMESVETEIQAMKKGLPAITAYKPWSKVPVPKKAADFISAMKQVFNHEELKLRLPVDMVACYYAGKLLQCIDAASAEAQEITPARCHCSYGHLVMSTPGNKWQGMAAFYSFQLKYAVTVVRGSLVLCAQLSGDLQNKRHPIVAALEWMLSIPEGFVSYHDDSKGDVRLRPDVEHVFAIVTATPIQGQFTLCTSLAWYEANRGGLPLAEDLHQDSFGRKCVDNAIAVNKGLKKDKHARDAISLLGEGLTRLRSIIEATENGFDALASLVAVGYRAQVLKNQFWICGRLYLMSNYLNALRAVRHRASAAVIELAFHCRSPLLVLVLSHKQN